MWGVECSGVFILVCRTLLPTDRCWPKKVLRSTLCQQVLSVFDSLPQKGMQAKHLVK